MVNKDEYYEYYASSLNDHLSAPQAADVVASVLTSRLQSSYSVLEKEIV